MKLRKLARLCEHDRLEPHWTPYRERWCPGGVFLADDTFLIEKGDDLVELVIDILIAFDPSDLRKSAHAILDALITKGAS